MLYQLLVSTQNQTQTIDLSVQAPLVIQAQPGAVYALLDDEGKPVTSFRVMCAGNDQDLAVEIEGETLATIEQFFAPGMDAGFSLDGTLEPASDRLVSSQRVNEQGAGLCEIWEADPGQEAVAGTGYGYGAAVFSALGLGLYGSRGNCRRSLYGNRSRRGRSLHLHDQG
jgi:hypothetical protein